MPANRTELNQLLGVHTPDEPDLVYPDGGGALDLVVARTDLDELLGSRRASSLPSPVAGTVVLSVPGLPLMPQLASAPRAVPPATPTVRYSPRTKVVSSNVPFTVDVRFELARALPALWAKAQRNPEDSKAAQGKEKLRDLLLWLLAKRNAVVHPRHSVMYLHDGKTVAGRLDLVARLADTAVAIELDWAYAKASIEKLQAAHKEGMQVMWVCGAKLDKTAAKALRARANADFGSTFGWLFMFHLEHGWL